MTTVAEAASDFLTQKRIAVTGVSRTSGGAHGGNVVYGRLRERGYEVFAVNPNADEVEGTRCYHSLRAIPVEVDAVVIAAPPETALTTVRDAESLGISRIWMHHGIGKGSVSDEATKYGRDHGMTVIDGGCPLMFHPTSDGAHRFVIKGFCRLTGALPKKV